jgi:hypothetical protein
VRKALATLQFVEQTSVYTNTDTREVRFNLTDKKAFDEAAVKTALKDQGFPQVTVKEAPPK